MGWPPSEDIRLNYEVYITREGSGVDSIERTANKAIKTGDVMIQGPYCGISRNDAAIDELVTIDITEGTEIAIGPDKIAAGATFLAVDAPVYWNNTTRLFTDTDTPGVTYLYAYVNTPQDGINTWFKALKRRFWIQESGT